MPESYKIPDLTALAADALETRPVLKALNIANKALAELKAVDFLRIGMMLTCCKLCLTLNSDYAYIASEAESAAPLRCVGRLFHSASFFMIIAESVGVRPCICFIVMNLGK